MHEIESVHATCAIVGGGPAGMMLGFLLARAGIDVVILEKHADFFRDFRGDTIHPSTLELLKELGLLKEFLKLPIQRAETVGGTIGDFEFTAADFRHLPTACKFIAFIPQWDFLDFLADHAKKFPTFRLLMEHEVTGLTRGGDRVTGVTVRTKAGELAVLADLVVAADGRTSVLRQQSGLEVLDLGAPFDVLWMRVSRNPRDDSHTLGNFQAGHIVITINREDYWQCAYIIPKGGFEEIKQQGLAKFQDDLRSAAPFLKDTVQELDDWNKIKLLTVQVNRLTKWHIPGLQCIGDAAHAMSPMGGVGINLAIQDAVAAANILATPLREKKIDEHVLAQVQARRESPTRRTQRLQVYLQNTFLVHILGRKGEVKVPFFPRLLKVFPLLQRFPARVIGLGFQPEHVNTPEVN